MAGDPTEVERAVRFVLRDVDADVGLHGADHAGHVRAPRFAGVRVEEIDIALVFPVVKPVGEGEVPERDHRLDASGAQLPRHADVARECLLVDHAGLRLDAGPLHAETEV
jgi:hypothetical protein